jgi:hypothetical protein
MLHPGYITWEQYEENLQRMRQNAVAYNLIDRKTPPREGPCLLQGLAICGKCGQRMTIRYKYQKKGRVDPVYLCQRHRIERWENSCQYIPGASIDEAISKLLLESVTPLTLDMALQVQKELENRFNEADKLRKQQVERAEYEANIARRGLCRSIRTIDWWQIRLRRSGMKSSGICRMPMTTMKHIAERIGKTEKSAAERSTQTCQGLPETLEEPENTCS